MSDSGLTRRGFIGALAGIAVGAATAKDFLQDAEVVEKALPMPAAEGSVYMYYGGGTVRAMNGEEPDYVPPDPIPPFRMRKPKA